METTPKEIALAVVDVETTGFQNSDRIVEIAVIRIDKNFRPVREYLSLINPRRDVGPTHIHGITASMVYDAPTFEQASREILSFLPENTLVVGHNVGFDLKFIQREMAEALGRPVGYPSFCTLKEGKKHLQSPAYNLGALCSLLGISNDREHSAMGDARATLRLFEILAGKIEEESGVNLLAPFEARPIPSLPEGGRRKLRGDSLPPRPFRLREPESPLESRGRSVCFTGTSLARSESGESLGRAGLEALAQRCGWETKGYVTRGLDLLAAADPRTLSGKARKARRYGVPIIPEREFWERAGLLIS